MKPTRNVRLGRICKKHPDENGLRYVGNNRCVECAKEESRKHYASLELTPAQKITTLLGEVAKLKAENETLRNLLLEASEEIDTWGAYASAYFQKKHDLSGSVAKFHAAAMGKGEQS